MVKNVNLRLGFITDEGESFTVIIKDPKEGLTNTQVVTAMDNIIESDSLSQTKGILSERNYARLVSDVINEVNIA